MQGSFVKLFGSILDSTIWREDSDTVRVWITLLAMADAKGRVMAAVPGIAARAVVPMEKTIAAIRKFQEPDEWSRSKEFGGRRIEEIDGGFRLLNYEKYREIRDEDRKREYNREWMRERRAEKPKRKAVDKVSEPWDSDPEFLKNFEQIWNKYPRKEGRAKSVELLWKVKQEKGDPGIVDVWKATQNYAKSRVGEDPKFTKMAVTFFNKAWMEWINGDPKGSYNVNANPRL